MPFLLMVGHAGTHTQPYGQDWFRRRREIRLHAAPTDYKWFSWAGAWLGELARKPGPRKALADVAAAKRTIVTYLAENPRQPQPFAWPAARQEVIDSDSVS